MPPPAPQIILLAPLTEVPTYHEEYVVPKVHDEYGVPEMPHEEYGPPPVAPLCSNHAPDSTHPFCCENGALNEFCCLGEWINPTCSEPTTTTTTTLAPYPPATTTTTTTPAPNFPYPAKVISHYEKGVDFQAGGSFSGNINAQVTAESSSGVIEHQPSEIEVNAAATANIDHSGFKADGSFSYVKTGSSHIAIPIPTFHFIKPIISFNKRIRIVRTPKKFFKKGFFKFFG